jgi:hypothetical protein
METHAKVVGILNIVSGVLGLFGALVLMVVFGGVTGVVGADGDPDAALVTGAIGIGLVLLLVMTSLPASIIGYGLYRLRPWSRLAGIVLSILLLIIFPFGTILGIYGLWVLFSRDGERLFEAAQATQA